MDETGIRPSFTTPHLIGGMRLDKVLYIYEKGYASCEYVVGGMELPLSTPQPHGYDARCR